jgi:predicted DNA-binding protein
MKNFFYAAIAALALLTVSCGSDDDENLTPPQENSNGNENGNGNQTSTQDETVTVSEETLRGTWDGFLERDFAQGYYQRWRIEFDGVNYTTWHSHQTAGSINDDVQGLKTVGNKEQGTWEYADGVLKLTPKKQWASYVITSMSPTKYTYYNYNLETMESDQWYETSEYFIKEGIERDIEEGTDWYIKKWTVVSMKQNELSLRINKDVFKLTKQ